MSHYEPKGDRSDAQPRSIARSAPHHRAGAQASTVKGGGGGGPSPSTSAPPLAQNPASAVQPLPVSGARSGRRSNGSNAQPSGASPAGVETTDIQRVQRNLSPQQQSGIQPSKQQSAALPTSNGAASRSSGPGTPPSSPAMVSTETVAPAAKAAGPGEWSTAPSPPSFQFGSLSPGFMHSTGVPIPARTSSAPPNLDEQRRAAAVSSIVVLDSSMSGLSLGPFEATATKTNDTHSTAQVVGAHTKKESDNSFKAREKEEEDSHAVAQVMGDEVHASIAHTSILGAEPLQTALGTGVSAGAVNANKAKKEFGTAIKAIKAAIIEEKQDTEALAQMIAHSPPNVVPISNFGTEPSASGMAVVAEAASIVGLSDGPSEAASRADEGSGASIDGQRNKELDTVSSRAGDVVSDFSSSLDGASKLDEGERSQMDLSGVHERTNSVEVESSSHSSYKEGHLVDSSSVSAVSDLKHGSKRKKMKDLLAKADAAGTTADLYNAYKAPEEKKLDLDRVSESVGTKILTTDAAKPVVIPEENLVPREVDNWEDAAELPSPKGAAGLAANTTADSSRASEACAQEIVGGEKYTRDFLLTFKDQCRELSSDFEVRADIAELLMSPQAVFLQSSERDVLPGPGRMLDRQLSGGPRRGGMGANFEDDRWTRQPATVHSSGRLDAYADMGPPSFRPGNSQGLIARMPSNVRPGMPMPPLVTSLIPGKLLVSSMAPANPALVRGNMADGDRWQRMPIGQKGLIPSPQTPLPPMHKAQKRYEVNKVSDEEDAKQRQMKGILNKLTPQNFEKLFEQVKEVKIQSAVTLTGLISQIFDKALSEPTFCETYAKFCVQLSVDLPEFMEDGEKVTFKRVLLNKCQEEFQRGEREQAEANVEEEDGEIKLTAEEREEKRVKAKRRMLGNIRFIGELYKKNMLTERIMHECIIKLLGEYENPEEEDVEALCKLMSTIGRMIDRAKAKEHIDAYFERMTKLSNNQKLSSRLRFMLKDVIDLRRNGWQERRKVEGPKKIEEVHRDAVHERQSTVSQAGRLTRGSTSIGPSSGRRVVTTSEFGMRGPPSPMYSPSTPAASAPLVGSLRGGQPQICGSYAQDVRMEDRLLLERTMPMPLSQRPVDEGPITLGPQGGLGRGMAMRGQPVGSGRSVLAEVSPVLSGDSRRFGSVPVPGYSSGIPQERGHFGTREEISQRGVMAERPLTPSERPLLERPVALDRYGSGASSRGMRSLERTLSDRSVSTPMALAATQQQGLHSRPSTAPALVPLSEERLKTKSEYILIEYFSAQDVKEAALCVRDLRAPQFHSTIVYLWISLSLDKKDIERDLLVTLLIFLLKTEPSLLKHDQIIGGFVKVLESLDDLAMDAPKAPEFLAGILRKLITAGVLSIDQIGKMMKTSEVQINYGLDMLEKILEGLRRDRGETSLLEICKSPRICLDDYFGLNDSQRRRLDVFLQERNLQCIHLMIFVGRQLRDHLKRNETISETQRWLERTVASALQSDPAFLWILMTEILKHCMPSLPGNCEREDFKEAIKGNLKRYRALLKRFASGTGTGTAAETNQRQYIVAVQLFSYELGHPVGLMTALFSSFYEIGVISPSAYLKWQDDVKDFASVRDKIDRDVSKWLSWLKAAHDNTEVGGD